jgi:hypothetical protein
LILLKNPVENRAEPLSGLRLPFTPFRLPEQVLLTKVLLDIELRELLLDE